MFPIREVSCNALTMRGVTIFSQLHPTIPPSHFQVSRPLSLSSSPVDHPTSGSLSPRRVTRDGTPLPWPTKRTPSGLGTMEPHLQRLTRPCRLHDVWQHVSCHALCSTQPTCHHGTFSPVTHKATPTLRTCSVLCWSLRSSLAGQPSCKDFSLPVSLPLLLSLLSLTNISAFEHSCLNNVTREQTSTLISHGFQDLEEIGPRLQGGQEEFWSCVAEALACLFHCVGFHLAVRSRAEDESVLLRVLISNSCAYFFLCLLFCVVSCVVSCERLLFTFPFALLFFFRFAFLRRPDGLAPDGTLT
jgi:hypothetical protein